jgi:LuxR family maltose regulon positive regulatory protein
MILQTKLCAPHLRPRLVDRPQLIDRLNAGLLEHNHKLTLVTAPAGFGKTTLVAMWLAQLDRPFSWISLDKSDNRVAQFLSCLLEALQQINFQWGRGAQAMLESPQPLPPESLLTALSNDVNRLPEPCVLVIDDYHYIKTPPIHESMAFWLEHLPPALHLVITARRTPPLPIPRLQARAQMTEISAQALRFRPDESTAFLRGTMGLNVSDADSQFLAGRTEGWAAGLQLAALSLQHRAPDASVVAGFSGEHRQVWDYLLQEIFEQEPLEVQQFLLATSILERLTAPLCDAVTAQNNGQTMLSRLDSDNLFLVALDNSRGWFRYHHLFREFLRAQVPPEGSQAEAWHRRAAHWYANHDYVAPAIEHGLAARDYAETATLILGSADELWTRGRIDQLRTWLAALPPETGQQEPLLVLYLAWAHFFEGHHAAMPAMLQNVAAQLDAAGPADCDLARGVLAAIRCALSAAQGDTGRTIQYGQAALARLPRASAIWRSVVGLSLGAAYLQAGQPSEALEAYGTASRLAEQAGNLSGALYGMGNVAALQLAQQDAVAAESTLRQALSLAEAHDGDQLPIAGPIHAGLGELLWQTGEVEAAAEHLTIGLDLCEQGGFARANTYEALAALRAAQDKKEEAAQLRHTATQLTAVPWGSQADLAAADQAVVQQVAQATPPGLVEPLSQREREVLGLIAAGRCNQAIAEELVVAVSTVKWHINNIYGKLGVRSRTQAVARARELSLIDT